MAGDAAYAALAPLSDHAPWLLDALLDVFGVMQRWAPPAPRIELVALALDILWGESGARHPRANVVHKAHATLAFLVTEMALAPEELAEGGAARTTFCEALLELARGARGDSAVGRIVAAKTLDLLDRMAERVPALEGETDVWVSQRRGGARDMDCCRRKDEQWLDRGDATILVL
jgi:hypothetical protein